MKYSFRNDYSEIAHPSVLKALLEHQNVQFAGYGHDDLTKKLNKIVCDYTGKNVDTYLISGGTMANALLISKALGPYEAVISADTGHINVHETGAVEGTGHKIIAIKNNVGKICIDDLKNELKKYKDEHMVLPKMVYLSNPTEMGTIYDKEELTSMYNFCKSKGLYLFIDGARLSTSLAASKMTLKDIVSVCDAFYLGGTKNGLPYGEMLVIINEDIKHNFRYHLKNKGAMFAKTFVLSCMFLTLLQDDLYLEIAIHANKMKYILEEGLSCRNVKIEYPNKTNQLFIRLDNNLIKDLSLDYSFEVWEEFEDSSIIRLITSFATDEKMCNEFLKDFDRLRNKY